MNKPLSCHIGKHFTKKVGKLNICMYCNVEVIKYEGMTSHFLEQGTVYEYNPTPFTIERLLNLCKTKIND